MKKRLGKFVFSVAATLAITCAMLPVASATSLEESATDFGDPWELVSTDGKAYLRYGYNELFINEDYAYANHDDLKHYSAVSNANGSFSGPTKSGGDLSRVDITHAGSSVHYYCYY